MLCVHCTAENPADTRRCIHCGEPLTDTCPHCHSEFSPTARFCPQCGTPVKTAVTQPAPTRAGERKQVTVLFADLAGFTAWSEKLDPEEVRDVMEQLWQRLDPIITGQGGR